SLTSVPRDAQEREVPILCRPTTPSPKTSMEIAGSGISGGPGTAAPTGLLSLPQGLNSSTDLQPSTFNLQPCHLQLATTQKSHISGRNACHTFCTAISPIDCRPKLILANPVIPGRSIPSEFSTTTSTG